MTELTSIGGSTFYIDPESVLAVSGPASGDAPARCYVTGPAPNPIPLNEAAAALVARLPLAKPLLRLTAPNGAPVWLSAASVTMIIPPVPGDSPPGEQVGAVIYLGPLRQAVQEPVDDVRAAVNRSGGRL